MPPDEEDARHAGDAIDLRQNLVLDPSPVRRHAALLGVANRDHSKRWPGAIGGLNDRLTHRVGIACDLAELVGHADERFLNDGVDFELECDAPAVHAGARLHASEPLHVLEHLFLRLEDLGFDLHRRRARPGRAHADCGRRDIGRELNREVDHRKRAEQHNQHNADDDRNRALDCDPREPAGLFVVPVSLVGHQPVSLPTRGGVAPGTRVRYRASLPYPPLRALLR